MEVVHIFRCDGMSEWQVELEQAGCLFHHVCNKLIVDMIIYHCTTGQAQKRVVTKSKQLAAMPSHFSHFYRSISQAETSCLFYVCIFYFFEIKKKIKK